ncbi:hypothetical protein [Rhodovastum atsumiense]|uniref:Uncharacterized protein n=1 Tax=Rhodovastum atsumiense TaxID=504468 RepID=A0A5M6IMS2_9PROT|nr:hypothetical protein [Rhodovastum atsumiense]KAA5608855.1 hypothetical protein F1189_27110 [Rhodovastum atsumiense]
MPGRRATPAEAAAQPEIGESAACQAQDIPPGHEARRDGGSRSGAVAAPVCQRPHAMLARGRGGWARPGRCITW